VKRTILHPLGTRIEILLSMGSPVLPAAILQSSPWERIMLLPPTRLQLLPAYLNGRRRNSWYKSLGREDKRR